MNKLDIKDASYNYLDHLYMKMMLNNNDIKSKLKMYTDEIKDTKNILSKLYIYITLNPLTNTDIKNAYLLLEQINNLNEDKTYHEAINEIKIILNSSHTIKEESYYLQQYVKHSNNKNDLSTREMFEILKKIENKETMNYQIEFDYYFYDLLLKSIFYNNNSIFKLINDEDMLQTNIVINAINFYLNEIPVLFKSASFRNNVEEILNAYNKLIKDSKINIFQKMYLKKQAKKCITKLN